MDRFLLACCFLSLILPPWTGCAVERQYRARVTQPHKDVLVVEVRVPERLGAVDYRAIADQEIAALLGAHAPGDLPIYEVRVDFIVDSEAGGLGEKVATFSRRLRIETTSALLAGDGPTLVIY